MRKLPPKYRLCFRQNLKRSSADFTQGIVGFSNIENYAYIGGSGDDSFSTAAGNDTLTGNAGNDYLSSGVGNDTLNGGAGNDTLTSIENLIGTAYADTLTGNSGANTLLTAGKVLII